jgi:SNF2 family DNA or RNA helicase
MENPVITVCLHTYCRSCIVRSIESIGYCPECRNFLSRDDFTPLPRENRLGISLEKEFRPSTKMEALMNHLKQLKADEKAVVFSQFLGMIDLIEEHMRQEHITHVVSD